MYRYLIDLRSYTDNLYGMAALFGGILTAVAFFTVFVSPLHNYIKYLVAAKRGDTSFVAYGYNTMSLRENFHLVGFITTLLLNISFTQPVFLDDDNLRNPRLSRVLVSLSGMGTYVATFLISGVGYSILRYFSPATIEGATVVPDGVTIKTYMYYALLVAMFYVFRISICTIFLNLIPIGSLDMADVLYMYLPINWVDGLRNNESLISLILFIVIFLTVGAPDGIFNVVGNAVMLGYSNMIISLF